VIGEFLAHDIYHKPRRLARAEALMARLEPDLV
jgi:hypothetical protein